MTTSDEILPLKERVEQASRAAYEVAKRCADADANGRKALVSRAREMDAELDRLVSAIMAAPPEEQPMLQEEWTNARLDLTYVMTEGKAPTSLRLNQHVQGR